MVSQPFLWDTPGSYAAQNGPDSIRNFAKTGGVFTDLQTIMPDGSCGLSAIAIIIICGPESIGAFAESGGVFTDRPVAYGYGEEGWSAAFLAVHISADVIEAFSQAGGIFTARKFKSSRYEKGSKVSYRETCAEYVATVEAAKAAGTDMYHGDGDLHVAYERAVIAQGGLRPSYAAQGSAP